ncbi:uncharacterized protein ACDP82_000406 [Pangshura tecta]
MYAKHLKKDLVELCRQKGLRIGRSTKDQLIAQLEETGEPSPVPEGSRPADTVGGPGPDMAGRGQTAAEDTLRPCPPIPRGGVGGSPANTEGSVASRGSSWWSSLSLERMQHDRELRWEELELRRQELKEQEKQCKQEEDQRQQELEEKEKQRKHELDLARLRSSKAAAAVSEGGPKPTKSFDKSFLAWRKGGEDIDTFLRAFENACELHRLAPADRILFLTPLLDSTAVKVYSRMKGAEAGDYELFKQALLCKFGLTPEMSWKRFQSQHKTQEVTYLQLVSRAQGYARKWTAGAQTKEDLLDLFIPEHLYEQCPPDLRL